MVATEAGSTHPNGMLSCYHPQTKFGQGNIFASVCHSVHRGGVPGQVPPWQVHPQAGAPLQQVHPDRYTPLAGTPRAGTPLWQCMLGYSQQAGGMHPTENLFASSGCNITFS